MSHLRDTTEPAVNATMNQIDIALAPLVAPNRRMSANEVKRAIQQALLTEAEETGIHARYPERSRVLEALAGDLDRDISAGEVTFRVGDLLIDRLYEADDEKSVQFGRLTPEVFWPNADFARPGDNLPAFADQAKRMHEAIAPLARAHGDVIEETTIHQLDALGADQHAALEAFNMLITDGGVFEDRQSFEAAFAAFREKVDNEPAHAPDLKAFYEAVDDETIEAATRMGLMLHWSPAGGILHVDEMLQTRLNDQLSLIVKDHIQNLDGMDDDDPLGSPDTRPSAGQGPSFG